MSRLRRTFFLFLAQNVRIVDGDDCVLFCFRKTHQQRIAKPRTQENVLLGTNAKLKMDDGKKN